MKLRRRRLAIGSWVAKRYSTGMYANRWKAHNGGYVVVR